MILAKVSQNKDSSNMSNTAKHKLTSHLGSSFLANSDAHLRLDLINTVTVVIIVLTAYSMVFRILDYYYTYSF